jgi:Mat/Ecp fimbriae major subunit
MNKLLISAGALVALALGTPAFAAPSNQASANATVNIVSPLTLTKSTDLNFGTIVGPFAGEIVHVDATGARNCAGLTCSGTVSAASFTLTGTANQAVVLTIPSSVTLNGSVSGTLSVDLSGDEPANPTLNGTGNAGFSIGGKLTIPTGTVDGVYSNTFTVTANYQ